MARHVLVPFLVMKQNNWGKTTMKTTHSRSAGFSVVEILMVSSMVGMLASFTVPAFSKAQQQSQATACVNTLRQMAEAKQMAALAMNWPANATPSSVGKQRFQDTCEAFLKSGHRPLCPTGAECAFNAIKEVPTCGSGIQGHAVNGTSD
jgi:type II secretory pathway pseudopilin PulG